MSQFEKWAMAGVTMIVCAMAVACGKKDSPTAVRNTPAKLNESEKLAVDEVLQSEFGGTYKTDIPGNQALAGRIQEASVEVLQNGQANVEFPVQVKVKLAGLFEPLSASGSLNTSYLKTISKDTYQCADAAQQMYTVKARCLSAKRLRSPNCAAVMILVQQNILENPENTRAEAVLLFTQEPKDKKFRLKWSAKSTSKTVAGKTTTVQVQNKKVETQGGARPATCVLNRGLQSSVAVEQGLEAAQNLKKQELAEQTETHELMNPEIGKAIDLLLESSPAVVPQVETHELMNPDLHLNR